jgi:hypothetical protein
VGLETGFPIETPVSQEITGPGRVRVRQQATFEGASNLTDFLQAIISAWRRLQCKSISGKGFAVLPLAGPPEVRLPKRDLINRNNFWIENTDVRE